MMVSVVKCPNLIREFFRFKKKIMNGFVTDEGNRRGNCHAIETCEYAAAHGLPYVKPQRLQKNTTRVGKILQERAKRARQRSINSKIRSGDGFRSYINLGPSGD